MTGAEHGAGRVRGRRWALGGLALMLVGALAACGSGSGARAAANGSPTRTTVTLGVLQTANLAPVYLGIQQGFFAAEGLDVRTQNVQSGNNAVTGALSGDFDVISAGYVSAITAIAKGLPLKVISANDVGAARSDDDWQVVMVGKGSALSSPRELVGRTVAINAVKGVGEVAVRASLDKLGVDSSRVTFTELAIPDMPAALAAGRVDAAFVPEPFLSSILAAGGHQLYAPYASMAAAFPNAGWATTDKLIKTNPQLVARFLRALHRSLDYATANPDAIRRVIPTYTKIPAEVAGTMRLPVFTTRLDLVGIGKLIDLSRKYQVIDRAPAADALVYRQQS